MKKYFVFFFILISGVASAATQTAIFAGGCFWCVEEAFEKVKGVKGAVSGFTGGKEKNPSYEEVSSGSTGHVEAVQVTYDDAVVSYEKLLDVFWKNVDPLDSKGQFCDKGEQYKSGIFYASDKQEKLARESLIALQKSERFKNKKIATFIRADSPFYPAEENHQDYYKKNSLKYKFYKFSCGRQSRLDEVWQ